MPRPRSGAANNQIAAPRAPRAPLLGLKAESRSVAKQQPSVLSAWISASGMKNAISLSSDSLAFIPNIEAHDRSTRRKVEVAESLQPRLVLDAFRIRPFKSLEWHGNMFLSLVLLIQIVPHLLQARTQPTYLCTLPTYNNFVYRVETPAPQRRCRCCPRASRHCTSPCRYAELDQSPHQSRSRQHEVMESRAE